MEVNSTELRREWLAGLSFAELLDQCPLEVRVAFSHVVDLNPHTEDEKIFYDEINKRYKIFVEALMLHLQDNFSAGVKRSVSFSSFSGISPDCGGFMDHERLSRMRDFNIMDDNVSIFFECRDPGVVDFIKSKFTDCIFKSIGHSQYLLQLKSADFDSFYQRLISKTQGADINLLGKLLPILRENKGELFSFVIEESYRRVREVLDEITNSVEGPVSFKIPSLEEGECLFGENGINVFVEEGSRVDSLVEHGTVWHDKNDGSGQMIFTIPYYRFNIEQIGEVLESSSLADGTHEKLAGVIDVEKDGKGE